MISSSSRGFLNCPLSTHLGSELFELSVITPLVLITDIVSLVVILVHYLQEKSFLRTSQFEFRRYNLMHATDKSDTNLSV